MTCRLCLIAPPSRANQGPEFSAMQPCRLAWCSARWASDQPTLPLGITM